MKLPRSRLARDAPRPPERLHGPGRAAAPKLGAYAGLCTTALLAALFLRRPELVALAAPFALALAFGLALSERAGVGVSLRVEPERALEGDEIALTLELAATAAVERLEVLVDLPPGRTPVDGARARALRLRAGESRLQSLHAVTRHVPTENA